MAHPTNMDIFFAAFIGIGLGGWGAYLLIFAKRFRDYEIRQLQKQWTVPIYRVFGAFFTATALFAAWNIIAEGIVPAPVAEVRPVTMRQPNEPLVQDAQSAIRIARALSLAERPDDGAILSEAQWQANCQAKLLKGVWHVTPKALVTSHNHPDITGPVPLYCSGAASFDVGAQDGRYMGEFFAD